MARASNVFPVPGGPISKAPLGTRPPSFSKRLGSFKNSTISPRSALTPSSPATSLKGDHHEHQDAKGQRQKHRVVIRGRVAGWVDVVTNRTRFFDRFNGVFSLRRIRTAEVHWEKLFELGVFGRFFQIASSSVEFGLFIDSDFKHTCRGVRSEVNVLNERICWPAARWSGK